MRAITIWWLKPAMQPTQQIVDLVMTEQLMVPLGAAQKSWVMRHQPKTLEAAIKLLEAYNAAEDAAPAWTGATGDKVKPREKSNAIGMAISKPALTGAPESIKSKVENMGILG
ncbi:hypothetical protein JRQ81_019739 [Phrynocephalus forsythii]|uniref:SCAN box domain-containing protein n=1 Tax=Phrynocephalus forsythii TaxID=171643 RepID=A0A9Q1AYL1_9SAUR|nr:hypothetical protein JRQ81_019739 [Phrynocephalus forsythii]